MINKIEKSTRYIFCLSYSLWAQENFRPIQQVQHQIDRRFDFKEKVLVKRKAIKELLVESEEGVGTVFKIHLPLVRITD